MSETIILAIIVCCCIAVVVLIITVGVLIYNYQDNKCNVSTFAGFSARCDGLDKRMDDFVTRMTGLEIKFDLFTGEPGSGMSRYAVLPNQSEKERAADESTN